MGKEHEMAFIITLMGAEDERLLIRQETRATWQQMIDCVSKDIAHEILEGRTLLIRHEKEQS
jgi:hypothetical protein